MYKTIKLLLKGDKIFLLPEILKLLRNNCTYVSRSVMTMQKYDIQLFRL